MKLIALTIEAPNPSATPITIQTPTNVPGDAGIIGNVPVFIITILITFVIVAAVAMIIFSGIQWVVSSGDAKKIEGARNRLTYAIIGLVIALAAVFIVGTTIQLLGGNPNLFNIGSTPPGYNQTVQQQFDNGVQHGNTDATIAPNKRNTITNPTAPCNFVLKFFGRCK